MTSRTPPGKPPGFEGYHMPNRNEGPRPPQDQRPNLIYRGQPARRTPPGGGRGPGKDDGTKFGGALLYVGFGLLAFFVFAAAFIAGSSPTALVQERIVAAVKQETGRDLIIGGASFSLFPAPGIVLRDVTLSSPPGMAGEPLARISAIDARLRVMPLLRRHVEIEQLTLRSPVFNLRVDKQGRRNWQFGATSAPGRVRFAAAGTASASDAGLPIEVAAVGGEADGTAVGRRTAPHDLSIGNFRIVNGTVQFSDERHSVAARSISKLNANARLPALDGVLEADGDLMLEGERVTFEGRLTSPQVLLQDKPAKLAFSADSAPLKISYDGSVLLRQSVDLSGALEANSPSARALARWAGTTLPPSEGFGSMSVKSQLTAAGTTLSLEDARIVLDGATATGSVTLAHGGERPLIKAKLALSELDLNKYATDLSAQEPAKPSRKLASPPSSAPVAPAGGTVPRSIDDLLKEPPAPQVRGYVRRSGWSDEPIDTASLGLADIDASLEVGRLLVREIKVGQSTLQVQVKSKVLTATIGNLALYDGKGSGTISVDGASAIPVVSADLTFEGISAQPFLRDAAAMNWLSGTGTVQLKITGQGATERAVVEALNGSASVRFTNGAIVGLNIAQILRAGGGTETTDFSELSATFAIANGIAQNNDLRLLGPLLRVSGSGQAMLGPRQLDYLAKPKVVGSLAGQGGPINLTGIEIPVRIKGAWDNPSFTPDLGAVLKDPSKATDVVREIGKQIGGKKAGDFLKGLLGKD